MCDLGIFKHELDVPLYIDRNNKLEAYNENQQQCLNYTNVLEMIIYHAYKQAKENNQHKLIF